MNIPGRGYDQGFIKKFINEFISEDSVSRLK